MSRSTIIFISLNVLWIFIATLATAALLRERDGVLWGHGVPIGLDFNGFWGAAQALVDGNVRKLFDGQSFWQLRQELLGREFPYSGGTWLYPPHFFFLIAPLGYISYLLGYALFMSGTLLVYLGTAWRVGGQRWLTVGLVVAPSTFFTMHFGQNGLVTAPLLVGGILLLERRPVLAGVLFGILTIKPTLGLLVVVAIVATRSWKATIAAVLTTLVLSASATALWGFEAWSLLLTSSLGGKVQSLTGEETDRLSEMVSMLPAAAALFGTAGGYAAQLGSVLLAATITYRVFRITGDPAIRAMAVACGTILATPYLYIYDLPMLTLALVVYVRSRALRWNEADG